MQAARCCHSGSGNEPVNEVKVVTLPDGARVRVAVKIIFLFLALRAEGWLRGACVRTHQRVSSSLVVNLLLVNYLISEQFLPRKGCHHL